MKRIDDHILVNCTAAAVSAGDTENDMQEACLCRKGDTDCIFFGYSEDDFDSIADITNADAPSFSHDDLETVILEKADADALQWECI